MSGPQTKSVRLSKSKRVPQTIKENVVLTFELLGGVTEYAAWARKNKDKFYDHWIKLLPAEIKAEVSVSTDFAKILEKARERVSERVINEPRPLEEISTQVRNNVLGIVDAEYVATDDKD